MTLLGLAVAACQPEAPGPPSTLVIWAWERPEDLRFASAEAEVAVQTGFVELSGEQVRDRGRHFPLEVERPPDTAIVHVEIDQGGPLAGRPVCGPRGRRHPAPCARLSGPPGQSISGTRPPSGRCCLTCSRTCAAAAARNPAIDDGARPSGATRTLARPGAGRRIVPMLFRMQEAGDALKSAGGGRRFRNPRCRSAFAVSTTHQSSGAARPTRLCSARAAGRTSTGCGGGGGWG